MEPQPTVADMMEAYAQDAVDHARQCGVALDFSSESIQAVEGMLSRMYDEMPRGWLNRLRGRTPSQERIWAFAKMYGGYLGEVMRRTAGGEWGMGSDSTPFAGSIVLRKNDVVLSPPAKVHKRLTAGPDDNVWAYFQVVMRDW